MNEFTNFTEKDYQSYINLLRLAFDAVLDAKTLEDAKKKASRAAVAEIHSVFGEFEIVQAQKQIAALEAQLAESQRREKLLRAVAEDDDAIAEAMDAYAKHRHPARWDGEPWGQAGRQNHESAIRAAVHAALQTAIDGGALDATQPPD